MVRRAGQARPVDVREEVHGVHDLRVFRFFLADIFVDVTFRRLGWGLR
jgi:hypothetical protein